MTLRAIAATLDLVTHIVGDLLLIAVVLGALALAVVALVAGYRAGRHR